MSRSPIIPKYARRPLLFMLVFQLLVYGGSKLLVGSLPRTVFETPWDLAIPFLPWSSLIYIGSYPFWVFSSILCVRFDEDRAWRFLTADVISKTVCFVNFLLIRTTNTRPEVTGTDFGSFLTRIVYLVDTPDNLFPSMHCLLSWLVWLGIRGEKRIPAWYRGFTCIFALLIFLSTLTTKQHVLVDVLTGWLLAEGCYWLAGKGKAANVYRRLWKRL